MPRKRKDDNTPRQPQKPEGYEVLIGFIKSFVYTEEPIAEMRGHPEEGRCYRIIRDPKGYRLHIGRENNSLGLDGLYLGKKLKDKRQGFSFEVEIVTPANYLELGISTEDTKIVLGWMGDDNADMWERLNKESDGSTAVINKLQDIIDLQAQKMQEPLSFHDELKSYIEDEERQLASITIDVDENKGPVSPADIENANRLTLSLSTIAEKDPAFFFSLLDVLEYLSSTYNDKYENGEIPNLSKQILTSTVSLGKGATVFNMMKYLQRYATTGFAKSDNLQDVYKTIHYALFEVQRRRFNAKK